MQQKKWFNILNNFFCSKSPKCEYLWYIVGHIVNYRTRSRYDFFFLILRIVDDVSAKNWGALLWLFWLIQLFVHNVSGQKWSISLHVLCCWRFVFLFCFLIDIYYLFCVVVVLLICKDRKALDMKSLKIQFNLTLSQPVVVTKVACWPSNPEVSCSNPTGGKL